MGLIKMVTKVNTFQNQTDDPYLNQPARPVDVRVYIRDYYAKVFNKSFAIEMMARNDFDCFNQVISRLEIIEFLGFGLWDKKFFFINKDEEAYYKWIKEFLIQR